MKNKRYGDLFLYKELEELMAKHGMEVIAQRSKESTMSLTDPTGAEEALRRTFEAMMTKYNLCEGEMVEIANAQPILTKDKLGYFHDKEIDIPRKPPQAINIPIPRDFRIPQTGQEVDRSQIPLKDALLDAWVGERKPSWQKRWAEPLWRRVWEQLFVWHIERLFFSPEEMIYEGMYDKQVSQTYTIEEVSSQRHKLIIKPKGWVSLDVVFEHKNTVIRVYSDRGLFFYGTYKSRN